MSVTINGSNTPTAGGVIYGDGTNYAATSAGSSGQLLQSNGASAPSWVVAPTTSPAGSTGQVQYNNAGAFGAISSGTSGQVLTSAGSGAAPTWATPSAGAMTLISTLTASSSASLAWTGLSGYDKYLLVFDDLIPSTASSFNLVTGTGAGPTYLTSNYIYNFMYVNASAGSSTQNGSAAAAPLTGGLNVSTTGGGHVYGAILIHGMINSTAAAAEWNVQFTGDGFGNTAWAIGRTNLPYGDTTAKTAIKLYYTSGNIASGKATLYGLTQ